MSRNINVNPAHYKVAGRERQGEGILQRQHKQQLAQQAQDSHRWQAQHGQAPAWETTPPAPLVETPQERKRIARATKHATRRPKAVKRVQKKVEKRLAKNAKRTAAARRPKPAARATSSSTAKRARAGRSASRR